MYALETMAGMEDMTGVKDTTGMGANTMTETAATKGDIRNNGAKKGG